MNKLTYITLYITLTILCMVGTAIFMLTQLELTQAVENMQTNLNQTNDQLTQNTEVEAEVIAAVVDARLKETGSAVKEDLDALRTAISNMSAKAWAAQAVAKEAKDSWATWLKLEDIIKEIESRIPTEEVEVEVDLSGILARLTSLETVIKEEVIEAPVVTPLFGETEALNFRADVKDDVDNLEWYLVEMISELRDTMYNNFSREREITQIEIDKLDLPKAVVPVWNENIELPDWRQWCDWSNSTPNINWEAAFIRWWDASWERQERTTWIPRNPFSYKKSVWISVASADIIKKHNVRNTLYENTYISWWDDETRPDNFTLRFACRI